MLYRHFALSAWSTAAWHVCMVHLQVDKELKIEPRTPKLWMVLDHDGQRLENQDGRRKTVKSRVAKIVVAKSVTTPINSSDIA